MSRSDDAPYVRERRQKDAAASSGLALALPDPQKVTVARIAETVKQAVAVREWCREHRDADTADELRRRLTALAKYVADREARSVLAVQERWTERLIGELLGPAENRGPATFPVGKGCNVPPKAKHEFRALAWWPDGSPISEQDFRAQIERDAVRAGLLRLLERLRLSRLATAARDRGDGEPVYRSEGVWAADIAEAAMLVEPGSVAAVITDPPYNAEGVASYDALAAFAALALKPGGSLVVMIGLYHLPRAIAQLSNSDLAYQWTLAYLTRGQATQVFQRRVNTFWKPLLWFVNGDYDGPWLGDVITSEGSDKTRHRWGQSESGMTGIIERFTAADDLVCDPYCGGGTTGVVSLALGRRFLGFDRDEHEVAVARGRISETAHDAYQADQRTTAARAATTREAAPESGRK